jgi:hypothetical protein
MIDMAVWVALSLFGVQDSVVITPNEPRRPDLLETNIEVRCGRNQLSLRGISGAGSRFGAPSLEFNRRRVVLPPEVSTFLLEERATYRVAAGCPRTAPAIQILIYRAQGAHDESISYVIRAIDFSEGGRITDHGNEPSTAEAFWFR